MEHLGLVRRLLGRALRARWLQELCRSRRSRNHRQLWKFKWGGELCGKSSAKMKLTHNLYFLLNQAVEGLQAVIAMKDSEIAALKAREFLRWRLQGGVSHPDVNPMLLKKIFEVIPHVKKNSNVWAKALLFWARGPGCHEVRLLSFCPNNLGFKRTQQACKHHPIND